MCCYHDLEYDVSVMQLYTEILRSHQSRKDPHEIEKSVFAGASSFKLAENESTPFLPNLSRHAVYNVLGEYRWQIVATESTLRSQKYDSHPETMI